MKSRTHDEAMAEYFRSRPTYAVRVLAEVCRDGDPAEVAILMRQMAEASKREMALDFPIQSGCRLNKNMAYSMVFMNWQCLTN